MCEEPATGKKVLGSVELEQKGLSRLQDIEQFVPTGLPEIYFVDIGVSLQKAIPVVVRDRDVRFHLARSPEQLVALCQEIPIRPQVPGLGSRNRRALKSLEAVTEHRPIRLAKDVRPQFDREFRGNAQDVPVKRGMVQSAQRQPVRHDRFSPRMPVGQDVCRLEEFLMAEPANGTTLPVRPEHLLSKRLLVQSALRDAGDIRAPSLGSCVVFDTRGYQRYVLLVDRDREDQVERIVSDDIGGPGRHVSPRHNAEQVDERCLALHRQSESLIVPMIWIGPPVPILEKPALADPVVVRACLSLDNRDRRNRQRDLGEDSGLENTLRANQWNSASIELETPFKKISREHVAKHLTSFREELKGRQPDATVDVGHRHRETIPPIMEIDSRATPCPDCSPREGLDFTLLAKRIGGRLICERGGLAEPTTLDLFR